MNIGEGSFRPVRIHTPADGWRLRCNWNRPVSTQPVNIEKRSLIELSIKARILTAFSIVLLLVSLTDAMAERDPELARKAADGMKAALADDKQAASYIERFDDQATKLASWKTLHEKVEGGDTACVTDLTLVEYDLGFLQGPAFVTKARLNMKLSPAASSI